MATARIRTARFPQHIREDAFAYYCAGHTRAEVVHRLRLQYGDRAALPGHRQALDGAGPLDGSGGHEMISDRRGLAPALPTPPASRP